MTFMDGIDTIREKAAEAAQIAAKKTRQLAEIAKSNVSIYGEEDRIKKAQQELGKLYYRDYVVGEDMDEAEYLPWCQQIDEARQNIADLRDYIEELKAARVEIEEDEEDEPSEDEEAVTESDFADMETAEPPAAEPAETEATEEPAAEETPEETQIEVIVCGEPAEDSEAEE